MAGEVTPMDVKLVAAVSAAAPMNVAAFCAENGISRQTFYKWRKRFESGGLEGLAERSRRPLTSPQATPVAVEDMIVTLRKELLDMGSDAGAAMIRWHLERWPDLGLTADLLPSEATIWRVLVRRGFITPEPKKRPRKTIRRFEADRPNERWQTDATKWVTGIGGVEIVGFLDDCSRLCLSLVAFPTATSHACWTAFTHAADQHGLPVQLLSDNGLCFSGKLRGVEVFFETELRAVGVRPITSRPFHPQTCGKIERFHQTLKKWLRKQPLAPDLADLQHQLDQFRHWYNHERPHRALGRITPAQRWAERPAVESPTVPLASGPRSTTVTINDRGIAVCRPWRIHIGRTHAGKTAHVLLDDTHAAIYIDGLLVHQRTLDTTRSYQPKQ
jgi:transposase InsO family protein